MGRMNGGLSRLVGIGGFRLDGGRFSSPIFCMWIVNALWLMCFVSVVVKVVSL